MTIKLSDIKLYSEDVPFKERLMANCAKPITWIFLHTNISANGITLISMIVALIGAAFMIPGIYRFSLVGLAFFCMFMLLDHVDGQTARFRNQVSKAGLYLDSRVHHLVEPAFFICAGIGTFMSSGNFLYLGAGIAASTFYLMRQLMKIPEKEAGFRALNKEKSFYGRINYYLFQFLRINYPFSLLFFAIILNITGKVLVFYAAIFLINLIINFYKTYKLLKEQDEKEQNEKTMDILLLSN